MINDYKLLVDIFKKDVTNLSHTLHRILVYIHQYNIRNLYKPGPHLFIADWQSRHNHSINKYEEISGMSININVRETYTDIPECMTKE